MTTEFDTVARPRHYNTHPSGLECIDISEHLGFLVGNAFKYIFRRMDKGRRLEDLKKALWYLKREQDFATRFVESSMGKARSQSAVLFDRYYQVLEAERSRDPLVAKVLESLGLYVFGNIYQQAKLGEAIVLLDEVIHLQSDIG